MFWNFWRDSRVKRERIVALDLLRGTFLMVIVSTHIVWAPSLFSLIGGRGELFASAAEGFFAISGMLVGFLYGPRVLKDTKKIFLKIWKRAGILYLLSVVFTFFYTAWAVLSPDSPKYQTIYHRDAIRFLIDTFTIRYAFGWADFLTRYAGFMLVAPFVVWVVARRRAYFVAILSFIVWYLFRDVDRFLPFASWQIIFIYGIILGFYLPNIEDAFKSIALKKRRWILGCLWFVGAGTFIGSIVWVQVIPYLADNIAWVGRMPVVQSLHNALASVWPYFSKDHVDPARIAVGIVWFAALFSFYRTYERQINQYTFGVVETFGKNSLFVYCLHAFILFTIDLYFRPSGQQSILANTVVTGIVLTFIYLLTRHRGIFARIRRQLLPSFSKEVIP